MPDHDQGRSLSSQHISSPNYRSSKRAQSPNTLITSCILTHGWKPQQILTNQIYPLTAQNHKPFSYQNKFTSPLSTFFGPGHWTSHWTSENTGMLGGGSNGLGLGQNEENTPPPPVSCDSNRQTDNRNWYITARYKVA